MLDIEALKEKPKIETVLPSEQPLPIVTDEEIVTVTRLKIENARQRAQSLSRSRIRLGRDTTHYVLFSVRAKEKYSSLKEVGDIVSARVIGRAESARMQQVVFGVMQEYGLDETLSVPDPSMSWKGHEGGIHRGTNGTAIEWRAFPSKLTPGLEFSRAREYIETTDENIGFTWHVSNGLVPDYVIGPIKRFSPGVEQALQLINQQASR